MVFCVPAAIIAPPKSSIRSRRLIRSPRRKWLSALPSGHPTWPIRAVWSLPIA